jgi:hypothetical protein
MELGKARSLAEPFFTDPDAKLGLGDKRLDVTALALADTNHDFKVDKQELIDALVADRVQVIDNKIGPAASVVAFADRGAQPEETGLRPTPWFRAPHLVGGDPANAPLSTRVVTSAITPGANQIQSNYSWSQMAALNGQDFGTLSGKLTTAADIAHYLDQNVPYDDARLTDSEGNYGSWSSVEMLQKGTGVCRDQHALARDLLIANGHEAVLLGYAASDQSHAVTAYQDKTTGKWGILEYGAVFPPEQLQANTAEEALLMVRPATLTITRFSNGGPNERSHVDGIVYTRTSRVYESFMRGPSPFAGSGIQVTNTGITGSVSSNDRKWQAGMQVVTDPRLPYLQGAVMVGGWRNFEKAGVRVGVGGGYVPNNTEHRIGSNVADKKAMGFAFVAAEEFHPELLKISNIKRSGITITAGSHTTAQVMMGTGRDGEGKVIADIGGTTLGTSSLKWNPSVTADKGLSLWNKGGQKDSRAFVSYGAGVDAGLLAAHYVTGGKSFPINQYVSGGLQTQPSKYLSLSAQGYVPLQNVSNDFAAKPLARIDIATPYLKVGMTQGKDQARYDISTQVALGKHVQLGAYGAIEQDRVTKQTDPRVGVSLSVVNF